jgi:hypothetical protein
MPANRPAILTIRAVCVNPVGGAKLEFGLACALMPPLPRPSVSPLPSWASRPAPDSTVVPFPDAAKAISRWWRGDRLTQRERQIEAAAVERLVDELEAEAEWPKGKR